MIQSRACAGTDLWHRDARDCRSHLPAQRPVQASYCRRADQSTRSAKRDADQVCLSRTQVVEARPWLVLWAGTQDATVPWWWAKASGALRARSIRLQPVPAAALVPRPAMGLTCSTLSNTMTYTSALMDIDRDPGSGSDVLGLHRLGVGLPRNVVFGRLD